MRCVVPADVDFRSRSKKREHGEAETGTTQIVVGTMITMDVPIVPDVPTVFGCRRESAPMLRVLLELRRKGRWNGGKVSRFGTPEKVVSVVHLPRFFYCPHSCEGAPVVYRWRDCKDFTHLCLAGCADIGLEVCIEKKICKLFL